MYATILVIFAPISIFRTPFFFSSSLRNAEEEQFPNQNNFLHVNYFFQNLNSNFLLHYYQQKG